MKVLFQSRTSLFSVPGGDTVQIGKTAEALRTLGCDVHISIELTPDLRAYDLVHLFNLTRPQELLAQVRNARSQHKSIVLSPIFVDYSEYEQNARRGVGRLAGKILSSSGLEYCKALARAFLNYEVHRGTWVYLARGHRAAQREILAATDVLLPNSELEMQRAIHGFPETRNMPYLVVPNAVDSTLFGTVPSIAADSAREGVLCVARIEGLKNQLNVVKAMRGLPWQLTLIGKPAPNHRGYLDDIREIACNNVRIMGEVPHEQLPSFYAGARVHVLASWMETTGLSSLEAGAMGCNLVITGKGDTREYFGDDAFYCLPDSVDSIRHAIIRAYETPLQAELRERILRNYTWQKAAERTLEAYGMICR